MGDKLYKVGDAVIITQEGDGCDANDGHGCYGGPSVGTVCVISAINGLGASGLPCGDFQVSYNNGNDTWWTTSEHFIPCDLHKDDPDVPASDHVVGILIPSLHPGSASKYITGHIRVDGAALRLQGRWAPGGKGWEANACASESLRAYIGNLPHVCQSIAGTSTKYAACQLRPDGDGVRVQIAGPSVNRTWGIEFVLAGDSFPLAKLKSQVPSPEPASSGAPSYWLFKQQYLAKFGTETPDASEPYPTCNECGKSWIVHFNADCPK